MPRNKVSVINVATLEGHKDSVYALTGDDKGYVYSSGGDGMVVQWDLSKPKDGTLIAKVDSSVYSLAYDPQGFLVIGNNQKGINVVDIVTKKELNSISLSSCGAIYDILVKDKTYLVCCQNGYLYKVEIESRKVIPIQISSKSLRSIREISNGFVVSDSLGKVYFLDRDLNIITQNSDAEKSIFGILVMDDQIKTVSRDCHLRAYKNGELLSDVVAHMYAINYIELSPNKLWFATASQDKTLKIWDMASNQLLKVIDETRHKGHQNSVNKLFWSRYSNLLVSCSDDRTLKIWQLESSLT
jgi:WD repeat-containing protein 61